MEESPKFFTENYPEAVGLEAKLAWLQSVALLCFAEQNLDACNKCLVKDGMDILLTARVGGQSTRLELPGKRWWCVFRKYLRAVYRISSGLVLWEAK